VVVLVLVVVVALVVVVVLVVPGVSEMASVGVKKVWKCSEEMGRTGGIRPARTV
jgi:hypothetical protein